MTDSSVSAQAVVQHAASPSDYAALIGIVAVVAALYAKRSADATDEAVDMADGPRVDRHVCCCDPPWGARRHRR